MGLWGNGQGTRLAALEGAVLKLETAYQELAKQFRALRDETTDDMERATRERRAAAARARRAGEGGPAPPQAVASPYASLPSWGARARRLARIQARAQRSAEMDEGEGHSNGVSP